MFRPMRRFKQMISTEACIELLKNQPRGVLSVLGDDGYPYGVPMDHWYNPENGHLYFHCALEGHKIDALRRCDKVSFCVMDEGYRKDGEWSLNINSVIVFGRIRFVENPAEAAVYIRQLGMKYTNDSDYVDREIKTSLHHANCLELIPEHITGKLVNES